MIEDSGFPLRTCDAKVSVSLEEEMVSCIDFPSEARALFTDSRLGLLLSARRCIQENFGVHPPRRGASLRVMLRNH